MILEMTKDKDVNKGLRKFIYKHVMQYDVFKSCTMFGCRTLIIHEDDKKGVYVVKGYNINDKSGLSFLVESKKNKSIKNIPIKMYSKENAPIMNKIIDAFK